MADPVPAKPAPALLTTASAGRAASMPLMGREAEPTIFELSGTEMSISARLWARPSMTHIS